MGKWYIRGSNVDFREINDELKLNPIIGRLLVNRGVKNPYDAKRFIKSDLNELYAPEKMKDLKKGAELLKEKIDLGKKIRIVGDYDVDGVMSIYILYTSLSRLGADVDYVIPHRIEEGYGINKEIVRNAYDDKVDTIITCDNGIAALEEVEYAKELGLDIIITDHHDFPFKEEDGERIILSPKADAIINPKNPECEYPFDLLCGANVAWKLMEYLYINIYNRPKEDIYSLLEFAAIATICDVVELRDENRIIVKHGLELINKTKNIGLRALIEEMGIDGEIGVYHIGFIIGPAINASGRLDIANKGVKLLLAEDELEAKLLAKELKDLNDERKDITETGVESVAETIENSSLKDDDVLIVYEPSIHESVAGIVAGRIKDKYYKPTIVLTKGLDGVKGSGRSIREYNIFEELTKCKELLDRFGGHPMAAGLSLKEENIDKLREMLNDNSDLTKEDLEKKFYIDLGLPIEYINYQFIEELKLLEPYGLGNPKPIFGERNLSINKMDKLGKNQNVLKFDLESIKGTRMEGILFNEVEEFEDLIKERYGEYELNNLYNGLDNKVSLDIIYSPSINEFRGKTNLQLIIENFRIEEGGESNG